MYRMIIAEDDHNIRNAIVRYVNWHEIGFSIAGAFPTGEEALQFTYENSIDAVLTDIRMAAINGLELIRKLSSVNPDMKFVILSGYDDFSYAQKAIQSGVFDYILKPVSFRQLSDTFSRLKELMDRERENNDALKKALLMLQEQFFNNLVKGFFSTDEEILKRSDELGLVLNGTGFWLARIEGNFYYDDSMTAPDRSRIKDSIRKVLEEVTAKYSAGFVFSNDIPELSILVNGLNCVEQVIEMLEAIKNLVIESLKQTLTISLSSHFTSLADSPKAYKEAGKGLECSFFSSGNTNIILPLSGTGTKTHARLFDELRTEEVVSLLNSEDAEGVRKIIFEEYSRLIDKEGITREMVYYFYTSFMVILSRYLRSMGKDIEHLVEGENLSWINIDQFRSPEEIPRYIWMLYEAAIGMNRRSNRAERKIIEKVKEYINEHYSENISLEAISRDFFMNYSYFSRLFKAEAGENFTEYVTRVRISNAMRMLRETNMKIYEISELVGYSNYRHFAVVFKKMAGCNAVEYREKT